MYDIFPNDGRPFYNAVDATSESYVRRSLEWSRIYKEDTESKDVSMQHGQVSNDVEQLAIEQDGYRVR